MSFVFVSGNLALDLAGTLKWRRTGPEELLVTPADLARWAVEAQVLTEPPAVRDADLDHALGLREAVYRLITARLAGEKPPAEDLGLVNACAAGEPPRLTIGKGGVTRTGTVAAVEWAVAWATAELFAEVPEGVIRECARTDCTRIFVDRSRTGNRRWCGMQECGNRIKAANYRARRAG